MSKILYTMTEQEVLDAIELWLNTSAKELPIPWHGKVHYDLKADEQGFRVEITESNKGEEK